MNLLLLDDDTAAELQLEQVFEPTGVHIRSFLDPAQAVAALSEGSWVAVLVSLDLAEGTGTAFLEALRWVEGFDHIPVVLTSAFRSMLDEEVKLAKELSPEAMFMRKPVVPRRLLQALGDLEASSVNPIVEVRPVTEDLPELHTEDLELLDEGWLEPLDEPDSEEAETSVTVR